MAVRKSNTARKPAPRKAPTRTAQKPAKASPGRDVTQYATKDPTELHKAMARWIVTEVGYDPNSASSKREAFLFGVSIATAARPAFTASDYLAAWYEESGTPKRGRGASTTKGRTAEPDEVEEDLEDTDDDETDVEDDDLVALEEELNGLAIGALRKAAKDEYDVSGSGTKQEIINRILDSLSDEEDEEEPEDDEESDEDVDLDELREELEGLSPADLKAAAKDYDITPKRGERKAALIDRILESVAAEELDDVAEDDDVEEEEEPPTKGRKTAAKGGKASKEFLF